jgi:hypothetical protein
MTAGRNISADTPLRDCPESRVGIALPAPISQRVDDLVELAEGVGERTTRKELLGSLILAAPARGQDLAATLKSYRLAMARDTLVDAGTGEATIRMPHRRPGPRPRRKG